MPLIRGAASDVTTFRRLNANSVPDPTIKTASYSPNLTYMLPTLRSSAAGAGISPGRSVLATPTWKGYVNSRHQGLLVRAPSIPPFIIDFDAGTLVGDPEIIIQADPLLDAAVTTLTFVITNFEGGDQMDYIEISNADSNPDYTLITFSSSPEFGSQGTGLFDTAAYQFDKGAYTTTAVFTVTFPVPTTYFTIKLYNS